MNTGILNAYFNILSKTTAALANQRHCYAVRWGLMLNMPVMVAGSFASVLVNLPLPSYQLFMYELIGRQWQMLGELIYNATFGSVALLLAAVTAYMLAAARGMSSNEIIKPITTGITAVTCFLVMVQSTDGAVIAMPVKWLGIFGLFVAILVSLLAAELFMYLSSWRLLRLEIFFDAAEPLVSQVAAGLIPFSVTVLVFSLVKYGAAVLGIADVQQIIYDAIAGLFAGGMTSLWGIIKYQLAVQILWFFGIHGQNALGAAMQKVDAAAEAARNLPLGEGDVIICSTFINTFTTMGGTGSTLCLIIALLIISRKNTTARLAKLSLFPAVFNINELLVFGLPIVLNPVYLLPFLLTPVIMTTVAYLAVFSGLVPPALYALPWTTPVLLSGYLQAGAWQGVVLQLINLGLGILLYLPFARWAHNHKQAEMRLAMERLVKVAAAPAVQVPSLLLNRSDDAGHIARVLAHDLKTALKTPEFALAYQPQVDRYNRVTGVEALLRWTHGTFGPVPAPLAVKIAEEAGMIHELGHWVIAQACRQLRVWKQQGVGDVIMSVNVSTMQFYQEDIVEHVRQALAENQLLPEELEIEITESIALDGGKRTRATLNTLHAMGVRLAIDDFGMGHSSLTYIKNFPVDTLKIDRTLSLDVTTDKSSREIVATIVALCASLEIKTIVEYVETEDQRNLLQEMGPIHCQGHYYSPAMAPVSILEYIKIMNGWPVSSIQRQAQEEA